MRIAALGELHELDIKFIERVANAAFSFLPQKEGEVEFTFLTKEEIQNLNFQYRGIDNPTDVLSFNISESPLIGQVFICYDILVEQAKIYEKALEEELSLLLVHGILHIFGYDHVDEDDYKLMKAKEDEILASLY